MTLRLLFHGGMCCAVKTLYGFTYDYQSDLSKCMSVAEKKITNHDSNGMSVTSDMDFFTDEAPTESYEDRLKRLIEFCKRRRPQGIIEATLILESTSWTQTKWVPILESYGFTLSCKGRNSNSSNVVGVFHLVYGDQEPMDYDDEYDIDDEEEEDYD